MNTDPELSFQGQLIKCSRTKSLSTLLLLSRISVDIISSIFICFLSLFLGASSRMKLVWACTNLRLWSSINISVSRLLIWIRFFYVQLKLVLYDIKAVLNSANPKEKIDALKKCFCTAVSSSELKWIILC